MSPGSTAPRTTDVPRDEWETPPCIRAQVQAAWDITLDVAATAENALTYLHYTEADNGLDQSWATGPGEFAWCNPPYSNKAKWIEKAHKEALLGNGSILLLPASTGTKWFHRWIWDAPTRKARSGVEVCFCAGRIKFEYQGKSVGSPTFDSMLVVFHPQEPR